MNLQSEIEAAPIIAAPILIWPFHSAPEELRDLSQNGGDEDWIAVIRDKALLDGFGYIPFLSQGSAFGVFTVEEYEWNDCLVLIGCHA